jgi:hypothetical protein
VPHTFSREDFRYDEGRDAYICPAGKMLTTSGTLVNDGITLLYRGTKADCSPCLTKARCCPKEPVRKISRSLYERARDVALSLVGKLRDRSGLTLGIDACVRD